MASSEEKAALANVMMPFFMLGFILLRMLVLPKLFPSLTRNEYLIFMLFIPAFVLVVLSGVEKSPYKPAFFEDEGKVEIIKAVLSASIAASLLTLLFK